MKTQTMQYCEICQKPTMHLKDATNHILHLLLSVVTGGVWLVVWLLIWLKPKRSQCTVCGKG